MGQSAGSCEAEPELRSEQVCRRNVTALIVVYIARIILAFVGLFIVFIWYRKQQKPFFLKVIWASLLPMLLGRFFFYVKYVVDDCCSQVCDFGLEYRVS